jgi:hypothetical protein
MKIPTPKARTYPVSYLAPSSGRETAYDAPFSTKLYSVRGTPSTSCGLRELPQQNFCAGFGRGGCLASWTWMCS